MLWIRSIMTALCWHCRLAESFDTAANTTAPPASALPLPLPAQQGLLLLLPVVLGLERLNTVYAEQLKRVLTWPQSVGIVGGRPGHSHYFIGYQVLRTATVMPLPVLAWTQLRAMAAGWLAGAQILRIRQQTAMFLSPAHVGVVSSAESLTRPRFLVPHCSTRCSAMQGDKLLCLDPHSMQPTDAIPGQPNSHIPPDLLPVPFSAIDSTMALGFYCAGADAVRDLGARMQALSSDFTKAPLVCVGAAPLPPPAGCGLSDDEDAWASDSTQHADGDSAAPGYASPGSDTPAAPASAATPGAVHTNGTADHTQSSAGDAGCAAQAHAQPPAAAATEQARAVGSPASAASGSLALQESAAVQHSTSAELADPAVCERSCASNAAVSASAPAVASVAAGASRSAAAHSQAAPAVQTAQPGRAQLGNMATEHSHSASPFLVASEHKAGASAAAGSDAQADAHAL